MYGLQVNESVHTIDKPVFNKRPRLSDLDSQQRRESVASGEVGVTEHKW